MFETVENISKTLANLEHERKAHLAELEEINKKIAILKETAKFFETDLNYCFEIPERLKTYLRYHFHSKGIKSLKVYNIYEMGRKKTRSIYGVGKWSIIDLDNFFVSHGLNWFD